MHSAYHVLAQVTHASSLQILFTAHKDGSINTTDWTKVELDAYVRSYLSSRVGLNLVSND